MTVDELISNLKLIQSKGYGWMPVEVRNIAGDWSVSERVWESQRSISDPCVCIGEAAHD